jgi:hypothetical protein
MKQHKHAKMLGICVHHIQQAKDTINRFKVKAQAGFKVKAQAAIAECSTENERGHDIQVSIDARPLTRSSGQKWWKTHPQPTYQKL